MKRAVRTGQGVSIVMAASVADEVAEGQLCALSVRDAKLEKIIKIVVPAGLPDTAIYARFVSHILEAA